MKRTLRNSKAAKDAAKDFLNVPKNARAAFFIAMCHKGVLFNAEVNGIVIVKI